MKRYKSIQVLLLLILSCSFINTFAQYTITIDDVVFSEFNGTIINYKADSVDIIIPNSFNVDGTEIAVTVIQNLAFYRSSLVSVVIPASVTTIEEQAFGGNALKNVSFEKNCNLQIIEESAFINNPDLAKIILPDNGNIGFSGYKDSNEKLYEAGDSITDFHQEYYAIYARTLTLEDVDFRNGQIIKYKGNQTSIIIPEYINVNWQDYPVTSIGYRAFYRKNLTNVIIPNTITKIDMGAFLFNNLSSINIPSSVTTIGSGAFNSNAITEINGVASKGIIYARNNDGTDDYSTIVSYGGIAEEIDFIPESVTTIGEYAFHFDSLKSIKIPENVQIIEDWAFGGNELTNLTIPESVTSIGEGAFCGNFLSNITVPQSVIAIGYRAFNKNVLTEMNGMEFNGIVYSRDNDGSDDMSTIVSYGGIAKEIDFIPNTVSTIGDLAFCDNDLTSITIPNSVSYIGTNAFSWNSLTSISLPDPVVKEGYKFSEWKNGQGTIVSEIVDFDTYYEAQFTAVTTAVDKPESVSIQVFPNPVVNLLMIKHPGKFKRIEIINSLGIVQETVDCHMCNFSSFDMSRHLPGIYVVKLYGEQSIVTTKVLKQ